MCIVTGCAYLNEPAVSVVVVLPCVLIYAFKLEEVNLAVYLCMWLIWYASIGVDYAVVDDSYGVAGIPVIVSSMWVAFGGEQRKYKFIRPNTAILVTLANLCVGFTIKDKLEVEMSTAYTFLFAISSACLALLDRVCTRKDAIHYHLLATPWILTIMDHNPSPTTVAHTVCRVLFVIIRIVFAFNLVLQTLRTVNVEPGAKAGPTIVRKTRPAPPKPTMVQTTPRIPFKPVSIVAPPTPKAIQAPVQKKPTPPVKKVITPPPPPKRVVYQQPRSVSPPDDFADIDDIQLSFARNMTRKFRKDEDTDSIGQ